jgi:hypothetical protein
MGIRESIALCKRALPLPELWRVLGLAGEPRKECFSPFRQNKNTEAFSVFLKNDLWFFKDHAIPEVHGDEIDLIMFHSGCEKPEAIKTYHDLAGIPMPEQPAPQYKKSSLGKIVKTYDYRNAAGQLVHQTVRYEPKNFRQRRPAEKGMVQGFRKAWSDRAGNWWISTLEGIEPVLYNLPAIVAAPPDALIFFCEGEKDADEMTARGNLATTVPMGAGKWRASYTETLKGRDVVIVGDRDADGKAAGENHVALVAKELHGKAKRVRVVNWEMICPDLTADKSRKIDVAEIAPRFAA